MLILPGDPLFDWTLACNLPPNWQQVSAYLGEACVFVASAGSGVLRPCNSIETDDYLYGGEYGDRLEEIDQYDSDEVECWE
jgi:hypothetical protein